MEGVRCIAAPTSRTSWACEPRPENLALVGRSAEIRNRAARRPPPAPAHLVPLNSGPHAGEMEVVTPMTTMDVTCPPGCKEGDQVRIQSPAGQVIQVAVPPGVSAGQVFQAQVLEAHQSVL